MKFLFFAMRARSVVFYIFAQVRADIRIRIPIIVVVVRKTDA